MKKELCLLVALAILISACSSIDSDTAKAEKIIGYHKTKFDNLPLSGAIINNAREISIIGSQYSWSPENVILKKGEKARLIVQTTDVQHGFEIEGLQIPNWDPDTIIKRGDKRIIEFTPDEAGVWDMVCTVYCGPGHGEMKGKFIVREK